MYLICRYILRLLYKPFSLLILHPSNVVKQYWVDMSQAKLNNGIENWGEKKWLTINIQACMNINHYTIRFMNFR